MTARHLVSHCLMPAGFTASAHTKVPVYCQQLRVLQVLCHIDDGCCAASAALQFLGIKCYIERFDKVKNTEQSWMPRWVPTWLPSWLLRP